MVPVEGEVGEGAEGVCEVRVPVPDRMSGFTMLHVRSIRNGKPPLFLGHLSVIVPFFYYPLNS